MTFFSAVLSLFLKQVLRFDEDMATVLYHAFTALCYFTPILVNDLLKEIKFSLRVTFWNTIG